MLPNLKGFVIKAKEQKVYKLSKDLYSLRQTPRAWNIRLDKSLKSLNFRKCSQEQTVYTRNDGIETIIVGVYVDDPIITGTSVKGIKEFKQQMIKEFEMTNLGLLTYYLGIEVGQMKDCIMVKQSTYAKKKLQQFKMAECNPTKYPMEAKLQLEKDAE